MKLSEAIERYGSKSEIARILGIARQSVNNWGEDVPPLRVYQLKEKETQGE